jgi:uncharacterized protein YbjT (DUF2867 family)
MPSPDAEAAELPENPVVLVAGATGYVGGRLIPLLEKQPVTLRRLVRNPEKLRSAVRKSTQFVRGDVLDAASLDEALRGVHTAYYLVHRMPEQEIETEEPVMLRADIWLQ